MLIILTTFVKLSDESMHFTGYHGEETVVGAVLASIMVFFNLISILDIFYMLFKFFVGVQTLTYVVLFNEIFHFSTRFYFFQQIDLVSALNGFQFF